MKISVIIPVYNRLTLLLRALKSVYSQTLTPYEVIVVDDGGDDELVPVLQKHFPQVIYIRQNHSGVSRARNNGVEHANGDWIAFLDSDDEWLPKKLEVQVKTLQDSQRLLCHTDEIWVRNGVRVNPHKKHQKYGGDVFQYCLLLCAISPSSTIISKALLEQLGGFDENLPACEDYDLWLRITADHQVEYIDQALIIKYGGHQDQLSQKYWGMDRFRIYSMEKVHNYQSLSERNKILLLNQLIKKCDIFSKGAQKYDNSQAFELYSGKSKHYRFLLDNMSLLNKL